MKHSCEDAPTTNDSATDAAPASIKRTAAGRVDIAYYERRARRLRARWIRVCIHHLLRRIVVACIRRRVTDELNALDERALHDIGIARSDIASVASGAYSRDDTRRRRDVPSAGWRSGDDHSDATETSRTTMAT